VNGLVDVAYGTLGIALSQDIDVESLKLLGRQLGQLVLAQPRDQVPPNVVGTANKSAGLYAMLLNGL